jgi:hypothetical protein
MKVDGRHVRVSLSRSQDNRPGNVLTQTDAGRLDTGTRTLPLSRHLSITLVI